MIRGLTGERECGGALVLRLRQMAPKVTMLLLMLTVADRATYLNSLLQFFFYFRSTQPSGLACVRPCARWQPK